uniref:Uncharacterized protein n=1 Tax=Anopheles christyi TaxID=43041 RepID=A0A182JTF3_9DIPT
MYILYIAVFPFPRPEVTKQRRE